MSHRPIPDKFTLEQLTALQVLTAYSSGYRSLKKIFNQNYTDADIEDIRKFMHSEHLLSYRCSEELMTDTLYKIYLSLWDWIIEEHNKFGNNSRINNPYRENGNNFPNNHIRNLIDIIYPNDNPLPDIKTNTNTEEISSKKSDDMEDYFKTIHNLFLPCAFPPEKYAKFIGVYHLYINGSYNNENDKVEGNNPRVVKTVLLIYQDNNILKFDLRYKGKHTNNENNNCYMTGTIVANTTDIFFVGKDHSSSESPMLMIGEYPTSTENEDIEKLHSLLLRKSTNQCYVAGRTHIKRVNGDQELPLDKLFDQKVKELKDDNIEQDELDIDSAHIDNTICNNQHVLYGYKE